MSENISQRELRNKRISSEAMKQVGETPRFWTGSLKSYSEIWSTRELLGRLVKREVTARYKDSSLGIVWSLFRPVIQLLIYFFVIGQVLGASRAVPDFAIFVLLGLTFWGLFSDILTGSTSSIIDNAGLVKKVYLPREIFPLSAVGSAAVNFATQLIVLIPGIIFLSKFSFTSDFWMAPAALAIVLIWGTALGLLLSAYNVYMRDIQHLVDVFVAVFFWVSPIVYPFTFIAKLSEPWIINLYLSNPITLAIIGAQKALWTVGSSSTGAFQQVWPSDLGLRLIISLLIGVVLLWISQRTFARLQGNFAQEI